MIIPIHALDDYHHQSKTKESTH